MKLFNKLIEKANYSKYKIKFFRLKKLYFNCLLQLRSQTEVEQLKFEVGIKKRMASVLKH